jgi:hypothetical protein
MPFVVLNATALAVAAIYYAYRDGYLARLQRSKMMRERIAYMLWTAAQPIC